MRPSLPLLSLLCALALVAAPAFGQLSQEHLEKVREQRMQKKYAGITYAGDTRGGSPTRHLHTTIIDPVQIDNAAARDAFNWWSNTTGIPLVINWREMEIYGIDPDTPISLDLRNVPASIVLTLMMRQVSPEQPLMYEVTKWYVRILTKEQANKEAVTLVYDIKDMILRVPNFPGAEFDLNSALSNTSSGGSSGGAAQASTTLFGDNEVEGDNKTAEERGEEIANIIRETIEPEIWQQLGGEHASIKFFNGRLIVKAPRYVHEQIGIPAAGGRSIGGRSYRAVAPVKGKVSTGIAGVRPQAEKVSGVSGKN